MATAIFEGTEQQVAVPDHLAGTYIAGNPTKIKYKLLDLGISLLFIILGALTLTIEETVKSELLTAVGVILLILAFFGLPIVQLVLMFTRGQTIAFILLGVRTVNFYTGHKAGGGMFLKTFLEGFLGELTFGIAPLIMWFVTQDEHGRTWYDRTCGVIVINIQKGRDTSLDPTVYPSTQ